MNDIEFLYIGWCLNKSDTGTNNDKVWSAFKVQNTYYAGWGARGKSIRFKKHDGYGSLYRSITNKQKEYTEVDEFQLFSMLPDYKEQVEQKLLISILSDKVM